MNPAVDQYLLEGCGRCPKYRTPACKVHTWTEELKQLRRIVLECGLKEELKWSQPCYTFRGNNLLMVTAFNDYAALAFFKGTLLKDPGGLLIAPGEHSQASRQLRFTNFREIIEIEPLIKSYIREAMGIEQAGMKIEFKKQPDPVPEELLEKFKVHPDLKKAFEILTPGRQRGYLIHFSQPKQSATRTARIERCMPKILKGEGFHDRYKARNK